MVADIPITMKAWKILRVGKPQHVLELKTDAPMPPPPGTDEIMIRISHVTINPGDYKMMDTWIPFRANATPGMDFAGEVVQLGQISSQDSSKIRVGMLVGGSMPLASIIRGKGTLAEYIVIPAHAVVERPARLDAAAAAGLLGVAGQTSVKIIHAIEIREGDSVLLNGASGGVGSILIQVLCSMGVRVTGVCSARNQAIVEKLGAQKVVDYTAHANLIEYLSSMCARQGEKPFDAIVDCVGNTELYYKSSGYLKNDGVYASIEGTFLSFLKSQHMPILLGGTPRKFRGIMTKPSGILGAEAALWYQKGWINQMPIDSIFSMEDVVKAFERQATGRVVGKVLVEIGQ